MLDLTAIKARRKTATYEGYILIKPGESIVYTADIDALLSEVERLQVENKSLRREIGSSHQHDTRYDRVDPWKED